LVWFLHSDSPFLGKRKLLLAYQGFERGVATFYDLPGIPLVPLSGHLGKEAFFDSKAMFVFDICRHKRIETQRIVKANSPKMGGHTVDSAAYIKHAITTGESDRLGGSRQLKMNPRQPHKGQ
jgi:hypothetical protein